MSKITGRPKHLFKPGQSGNPKGRPVGIKSRLKYSDKIRAAFELAFEKTGGVEALAEWAIKNDINKAIFYGLMVRVMPKDVQLSGHDGKDVSVKVNMNWVTDKEARTVLNAVQRGR